MKSAAVAALVSLIAVHGASAMTRDEQKAAKAMLKGKLYLRIDAPSETGRHPYGIYHRSLVEVTPAGANTAIESQVNVGWFHAGSTDWSVRVNDVVELDEAEFEDNEVQLELEGVDASEDRDTALKFVQIQTLADFEAAFDHTFSKVPLQEEHPDWAAEVKQAIAARQLREGMTKRQVYYVVGRPESIEKSTEDGKEVETWSLRQQGLQIGFFGSSLPQSQSARTLRFVNGQLTLNEGKLSGSELNLD